MCRRSGETIDHLLLHSDVARDLWDDIFNGLNFHFFVVLIFSYWMCLLLYLFSVLGLRLFSFNFIKKLSFTYKNICFQAPYKIYLPLQFFPLEFYKMTDTEEIPLPFQLQTHQEPIHPPGKGGIKYHEVRETQNLIRKTAISPHNIFYR